jgi:aromatic ring-opening dioxygenase catalytic subunit (LigB family)
MAQENQGRYDRLEASLKALPQEIGSTPKAILVISGHWEEKEFTVMSTPEPPMIYDYFGFPEHTYHIHYRAPGAPALALRVQQLLSIAGFATNLDSSRGFDHGTYVPLFVAFPKADIPVIQLSMKSNYDPATHLAAGRALQPLRSEGVVIIGSGSSYHNLRNFGSGAQVTSSQFDQWLSQTLCQRSPQKRIENLLQWEKAPSARAAHPREDHLIPLMVALGAAEGEKGHRIYHEDLFFGGISNSSFRFGES